METLRRNKKIFRKEEKNLAVSIVADCECLQIGTRKGKPWELGDTPTMTVRVKAIPFIHLYVAQGQTRDVWNREDGISHWRFFMFLF